MYEFLDYAVAGYMVEHPNTSRYSVMREVVGMAYSESLPEPMAKRLERNSLMNKRTLLEQHYIQQALLPDTISELDLRESMEILDELKKKFHLTFVITYGVY